MKITDPVLSSLKILTGIIMLFQLAVILCLPLIPAMNDSAWYYMNVYFVKTGNYISESNYPSFHEPSQCYPFLGYSFFLYMAEKISGLTHISWPIIIKLAQFSCYVASATFVRKITFLQTKRLKLSYIICILFLCYYPYFNYTNAVMSETLACFTMIIYVYLFLKVKMDNRPLTLFLFFFISGYSVLLKAVYSPIILIFLINIVFKIIQEKKFVLLLYTLSILIFPLSQSVFSKIYYGNYTIQTGLGWHLWDRIIESDKSIPVKSTSLEELKAIYAEHKQTVSFGFWWDVTADLSRFGYSETQAQEMCKNISIDGLRQEPADFIFKTFRNSAQIFASPLLSFSVQPYEKDYSQKLQEFGVEPQHVPLVKMLEAQYNFSPYANTKNFFLKANYKFSQVYDNASFLFHNYFILFLYILSGIYFLYDILKDRITDSINNMVIWSVPFIIVICSNMLEFPQTRYILPAAVFIIITLAIFFNSLYLKLPVPRTYERKNQ